MRWTDRDKFLPRNSTPKMSFLRVLVVMQNVLRLWQKVATNPLNNMVHDNLPREKRKQRKSRSSLDPRYTLLLKKQLTLWQYIRVCALRHSVAMILHHKLNMATKTAQICDQPKESEESGRKCLCMLASRATKLVTVPWRVGSVLWTQLLLPKPKIPTFQGTYRFYERKETPR